MMEQMFETSIQKNNRRHSWKQRIIKFLNSAFINHENKNGNSLVIQESLYEDFGSDVDSKTRLPADDSKIIIDIMINNTNHKHSVAINIKNKTLEEIYQSAKQEFSKVQKGTVGL